MRRGRQSTYAGFTLMEILIAMGIFGLIGFSVTSILITSLRSNTIISEQLDTQREGRKVIAQMVDELRRAEESSLGGFPIEFATTTELIFFSNIDTDVPKERVRLWLSGTDLKKGVVQATGTPASYPTSTEAVVTLAHNVKNTTTGTKLFRYYDENYTGTQGSLAPPIDETLIRMVRITMDLDTNPTSSPSLLQIEATVHVRNLKTN